MTTRGRPPGYPRPFTPPDPTLTTRPVPRTRTFQLQSYGPGAAPNIRDLVRNPKDVRAESDPSTYFNSFDAQYCQEWQDEIYRLIENVAARENVYDENDELLGVDPTWGFYAFVVDYDSDVLAKIPAAVQNLIETTRRSIRAQSSTAFTEEAIRRFKIDVVQDEEALSDASDDRIREEFRAYLRGIRQLGEDGLIHGTPRNYACLCLDRATIHMLADLTFPENVREDWQLFRDNRIKVVDAWWKRLEVNSNGSAYRGVDGCPIACLTYLYQEVITGSMEDLWPLKKVTGVF